jgi:Sulfatase
MTPKPVWSTWQYLVAGISLANLSFLRRWEEILTYTPRDEYFMKVAPLPVQDYACILNVLCLGLLFAAIAYLISHTPPGPLPKLAHVGFLALLVIPLNALREVLADRYPYLKGQLIILIGERATLVIVLLLGALLLGIFILRPLQLYAATMTGLLILSPFVVLTFVQALWKAALYDPTTFLNQPLAPRVMPAKEPEVRVVWFIFDELDERLTFIDRKPGLQLPELDRVRQASVYATHAYSPTGATLTSLPSLITGRLVDAAHSIGRSNLQIRYRGSNTEVSWSTQPNVFARACSLGLNTALVGWYHPYCRVLASDLTQCEWVPIELMSNVTGSEFLGVAWNQLRSLFESSLYSPFGQSLLTLARIRRESALTAWARAAVTDPYNGFVFVHVESPHAPHSYNRRTRRFDLQNSGVEGYLDSLALVDRILGDLRRAMEQANVWSRTAVLISADHWYRTAKMLDGKLDFRVPFLLKLPGQTNGVTFDQPFNTVLSQVLLLCVLEKKVSTPEEALRWLSLHHSDAPIRTR